MSQFSFLLLPNCLVAKCCSSIHRPVFCPEFSYSDLRRHRTFSTMLCRSHPRVQATIIFPALSKKLDENRRHKGERPPRGPNSPTFQSKSNTSNSCHTITTPCSSFCSSIDARLTRDSPSVNAPTIDYQFHHPLNAPPWPISRKLP